MSSVFERAVYHQQVPSGRCYRHCPIARTVVATLDRIDVGTPILLPSECVIEFSNGIGFANRGLPPDVGFMPDPDNFYVPDETWTPDCGLIPRVFAIDVVCACLSILGRGDPFAASELFRLNESVAPFAYEGPVDPWIAAAVAANAHSSPITCTHDRVTSKYVHSRGPKTLADLGDADAWLTIRRLPCGSPLVLVLSKDYPITAALSSSVVGGLVPLGFAPVQEPGLRTHLARFRPTVNYAKITFSLSWTVPRDVDVKQCSTLIYLCATTPRYPSVWAWPPVDGCVALEMSVFLGAFRSAYASTHGGLESGILPVEFANWLVPSSVYFVLDNRLSNEQLADFQGLMDRVSRSVPSPAGLIGMGFGKLLSAASVKHEISAFEYSAKAAGLLKQIGIYTRFVVRTPLGELPTFSEELFPRSLDGFLFESALPLLTDCSSWAPREGELDPEWQLAFLSEAARRPLSSTGSRELLSRYFDLSRLDARMTAAKKDISRISGCSYSSSEMSGTGFTVGITGLKPAWAKSIFATFGESPEVDRWTSALLYRGELLQPRAVLSYADFRVLLRSIRRARSAYKIRLIYDSQAGGRTLQDGRVMDESPTSVVVYGSWVFRCVLFTEITISGVGRYFCDPDSLSRVDPSFHDYLIPI